MRVGINSNGGTLALATLLNNIDLVVEQARVNRMYAMIGYFVVAPGAFIDNVATNRTRWITFWSAASSRLADKPWVILEMVNEPSRWGQVANYTAALKDALKAIYDAMRAGAPDSLIVWPSPANLDPSAEQYATLMQSLNTLGNGQSVDWDKTALGHHYYNQTQTLAVSGAANNATDGGRAGLLALAATYPLFMTETNWWVEAARIGLIDALDLYEEIGIAWTLLRAAGQTTPYPTHPYGQPPLGPLFLENKIAQLRTRGFSIPVE